MSITAECEETILPSKFNLREQSRPPWRLEFEGRLCLGIMGSFWGSVMLLFAAVLLRTEGKGAQESKNNVPRLKLSYKGEVVFAFEIYVTHYVNDSATFYFLVPSVTLV